MQMAWAYAWIIMNSCAAQTWWFEHKNMCMRMIGRRHLNFAVSLQLQFGYVCIDSRKFWSFCIDCNARDSGKTLVFLFNQVNIRDGDFLHGRHCAPLHSFILRRPTKTNDASAFRGSFFLTSSYDSRFVGRMASGRANTLHECNVRRIHCSALTATTDDDAAASGS